MSIRKKLFAIFAGVIVGMVLLVLLLDGLFLEDYYILTSKNRMEKLSDQVITEYEKGEAGFQEYIENLGNTWDFNIRIIDRDFNILYTSNKNKFNRLSNFMISMLEKNQSEIDKNKYKHINLYDDSDNISKLMYIEVIDTNTSLILTKSLKSLENSAQISNQFFIFGGVFVAIAGLTIIWFFSRRMTNSISEISYTAKAISNLDFTNKVVVNQKDELGDLADSINDISDKLSAGINNLKDDIEKRKNLVRDMSHELKIPIAAVKGYAEGLKYSVANDPDKMQEYCDVIVDECDKMDTMVKSMLELSQMENMAMNINMKIFKTAELSQSVEKHFELELKKKNIILIVKDVSNGLIEADYQLMERVCFNLIENAVRYTPEFGEIHLKMRSEENKFILAVYNSGSSLSKQDIEHIWEVFYKADKARTRNENRNYGIGLAIIKSIAKIHQGDVFVENKRNGIEFGVTILQRDGAVIK